jgi:hypothetical protein
MWTILLLSPSSASAGYIHSFFQCNSYSFPATLFLIFFLSLKRKFLWDSILGYTQHSICLPNRILSKVIAKTSSFYERAIHQIILSFSQTQQCRTIRIEILSKFCHSQICLFTFNKINRGNQCKQLQWHSYYI